MQGSFTYSYTKDEDEQDKTRRGIMILECDDKTTCIWPVVPCPNLLLMPQTSEPTIITLWHQYEQPTKWSLTILKMPHQSQDPSWATTSNQSDDKTTCE